MQGRGKIVQLLDANRLSVKVSDPRMPRDSTDHVGMRRYFSSLLARTPQSAQL